MLVLAILIWAGARVELSDAMARWCHVTHRVGVLEAAGVSRDTCGRVLHKRRLMELGRARYGGKRSTKEGAMATKKKQGKTKKRRLGMGLSGMLSEPVPVAIDSGGSEAAPTAMSRPEPSVDGGPAI